MAQVTCKRCGNTREGLAAAPLPGEMGQKILANTCQECWAEWLRTQVMIINEYQLTMVNPDHVRELYRLAGDFLNVDGKREPGEASGQEPEGYRAPEQ